MICIFGVTGYSQGTLLLGCARQGLRDGDDFLYDLEFNDNTFQNQEAENNCVQVLAANTGGNDVWVYGDKNETATGSGDIEQDAYQESDQVIQQA